MSVLHRERPHVVTPAAILLRGHVSDAADGPGCECDRHEFVAHGVGGCTYSSPILIRCQHPAWQLAMWVYSDRLMTAVA